MANRITCTSPPRIAPQRCIELQWSDGSTSRFHNVWLYRQRFHPAINAVDGHSGCAFEGGKNPEALQVRQCSVVEGYLVVSWLADGVETRYPLDWLHRNAYDLAHRRQRKAPLSAWTGRQANQFQWHDWHQVMQSDDALWRLFTALRDRGLARVRGAPAHEGAVARLAEKFGPLRVTDFGTIGNIRSIPNDKAGRAANIGASGFRQLGPHTDEGWRYAPPGVLFHLCLESAPSGEGASMLVDGLLAAQRLRQKDIGSFEFLTQVPLRFAAARNLQERYFARGRIIATDVDGDIVGVRFSDRTLGVQDLAPDQIEPAYRALRAFAKELYAEDLIYSHTLACGEMHLIDNHRVMHARASFDPQNGARWIQSCAVDREEFHNQMRHLAQRLGYLDDLYMILPNGALG